MAVTNTRRVAGAERVVSARRMMVIGAHSADFVWRAGGAIAVDDGGRRRRRRVIALSYGERGESGELWKEDRARRSRTSSGSATARPSGPRRHLGATSAASTSATTRSQIDGDGASAIADEIREFAPDVLDHPHRHRPVQPGPPDRPLRGRPRARPGRRGRRRERVRDDQPAGAVPVRAPPAGAVQLHADHVRRHHRA